MTDLYVQSDANVALGSYISVNLKTLGYTDVYVGASVPSTAKPKMVILTNNGGSDINQVLSDQMVTVNIWHTSQSGLSTLSEVVHALAKQANNEQIANVHVVVRPTDVALDDALPHRFMRYQVLTRPQQTLSL